MILMSLLLLAAAAEPPKAGKRDPNETICRTVEDTSSRLARKRICHTRAEWEELRRADQQQLREKQYNGAAGPGGSI